MMKLNVWAFALTSGILWTLYVLLGTWWILLFEGPNREPTLLGLFYRGYNLSFTGSLIGAAWALPDGLICGALFAWLYNRLGGSRRA